jgi:hypothetical protein
LLFSSAEKSNLWIIEARNGLDTFTLTGKAVEGD